MLLELISHIEWFTLHRPKIAAVIGFCCLLAPRAVAQPGGAPVNSNPILSAQLELPDGTMMEAGIKPEAMLLYRQAIQELHQGKSASAEKDAGRAVQMDAKFADGEALAATAALQQRQFARACDEAGDAVQIDGNDEKAWVILATADNYLAEYDDAVDALQHVRQQDWGTWQVAYQWARAEADLNNAAQTLEWSDRAALTAPSGFAPLHLLRASALLAAGRNGPAADELETYLQLLGKRASERAELTRELHRIRALPRTAAGESAEYNALAN